MSEAKKVSRMFPIAGSLFAIIEAGPEALKARIPANHRRLEPVPIRQDYEVSPTEIQAAREATRETKENLLGSGTVTRAAPGMLGFRRGDIVRYKPTGRKVTVLSIQGSSAEVVDNRSGDRAVVATKKLAPIL